MTRRLFALIAAAAVLLPAGASGQERGRGAGAPVPTTVIGQVRVTKRAANVHAAPTSTAIVLVNVPQGTALNVLEQRGVWVTVQLTPALRQQGSPIRWYRNEAHGFMHNSTVETLPAGPGAK
jgi:hypothetical protein